MGIRGHMAGPEPDRTEELASVSSTIGQRTALRPLRPEPTVPRWLGVGRCTATEIAPQDEVGWFL